MSAQRTLFVSIGPTGSGKSFVVQKACNFLGINARYLDQHIIDDLITKSEYYKNKINEIIDNTHVECETNGITDGEAIIECVKTKLKADKELLKTIETIYFGSREEYCDITKGDMKCDDVNNQNIVNSLKDGKNLVLENTGKSVPSWIWEENEKYFKWLKQNNYRIVFLYPMVKYDKLVVNIENRFNKSIHEYLDDRVKNPAPRIPNIYELPKFINACRDTTVELLSKCVLSKTKDLMCGEIPIYFMLFDNNENKMVLKYDNIVNNSWVNSAFTAKTFNEKLAFITNIIDKYTGYPIPTQLVGGKKRTKYNRRRSRKCPKHKTTKRRRSRKTKST